MNSKVEDSDVAVAATSAIDVGITNNQNNMKIKEEDSSVVNQKQKRQHQSVAFTSTSLEKVSKSTTNNSNIQEKDDDEIEYRNRIAVAETKKINFLRGVVLILLLSIAALATIGVYRFTVQQEQQRFENDFTTNANTIIDSFHDAIERRLGAVSSMSNSITSFALSTYDVEFPFVTLPHFEVHGADLRIEAAALIIHWLPLVTDENRLKWEQYALENRFQIDETFTEDTRLRLAQDEAFGFSTTAENSGDGGDRRRNHRTLQQQPSTTNRNITILEDGTGYHPKIWSIGNGNISPMGDIPEGNGPYLPVWQRSPMNPFKQKSVNIDFSVTDVFRGVLEKLLATSQAIMNRAVVPSGEGRQKLAKNLEGSQFRFNAEPYLDDPITFLAYPVFDSFQPNRQVAGVLALNVYWRRFFTQILPESANGYVCIIENSYNQTLAYRLDGPDATFLGEEDVHDSQFDYLAEFADINEFVQQQASPETRSYTTVPLNREFGKYRLRIYPTSETREHFQSNKPWVYGAVILVVFVLTLVTLTCLDRVVARRQQIVMDRMVKTAEDKIAFEKDLNTFLAHEVRNPIAAALSAHGFVAEAVTNLIPPSLKGQCDENVITSLQGDVAIIGSSLYFIDDFLRSMLDLHMSEENKLHVHLAPADLKKDILDPVRSILFQRDTGINVQVDCPDNLLISTDRLRLKQIIMNLGRNSLKFTTNGFVRFRAAIVENLVELSVEDSGGGIPVEKRGKLFQKFQTSLDELNQGTGLGLSLCETLVTLLNGHIYLDNDYNSGVPGSPGARFVVQLNTNPIPPESILDFVPSEETRPLDNNQSSRTGSTEITSLGGSGTNEDQETHELAENLSILFVDDDPILRKLFSRSVKKAAPTWNISEAASGEAAIQLVDESSGAFDLIFMDQYMASTQKQLLGTETIRILRAKGVCCAICGLSANDIEEAFLQAGADGFILKPLPCKPDALKTELIRITHAL